MRAGRGLYFSLVKFAKARSPWFFTSPCIPSIRSLRTQVNLARRKLGITLLWVTLAPQCECTWPGHMGKQSTMNRDHRSQANRLAQAGFGACSRKQQPFAALQWGKCNRLLQPGEDSFLNGRRALNSGDSVSAHQCVVLRIKWVLESRSGKGFSRSRAGRD